VEQALRSIQEANAIAVRIDGLTSRILARLGPTARSAGATISLARSGARSAARSRRLTQSVAGALQAIASYQLAGSGDASITNAALRRILRALRRTNRNFPGR